MWIKSNSKTWRHSSGAIVSNESYTAHGISFKHIYTYKDESDFSKGNLMGAFKSIAEAKNSIALTLYKYHI